MNEMQTELRKVLNKYKYDDKIDLSTFEKIIKSHIKLFQEPEKSTLVSLMALGNALKHLSDLCEKYEPGYWEVITSDDVIGMSARFAIALMKLR